MAAVTLCSDFGAPQNKVTLACVKYSESINIQDKEYYQGNRETYCKDEIDGKSR